MFTLVIFLEQGSTIFETSEHSRHFRGAKMEWNSVFHQIYKTFITTSLPDLLGVRPPKQILLFLSLSITNSPFCLHYNS